MRTDRQTGRTKLTADFANMRMRLKIGIIQRLRSMAVQRPGREADHSSLGPKVKNARYYAIYTRSIFLAQCLIQSSEFIFY
jgi:hypothetical protein